VGQPDGLNLPDVDTGSEPDTDSEGDSDINAGRFTGLGQRDEEAVQSNVPVASELQDQDVNCRDLGVDNNSTQIGYRVHIEKFTLGRAGAPMAKWDLPANHRYQHVIYDADNIYAPFTSKLDWEIAWWGKMRGSSSTALNELLTIDGVSVA
jgi:hypothetical protein